MAGYAKVDSVQKLKDFKVDLSKFAQIATMALEGVDTEIQHVLLWLRQDQNAYWKGQLRRWSDNLAQAKLVLKNKQLFDKTTSEGNYSYIDEKKIIAKAEKRLAEAQDKLNKIQRWTRELEKESLGYKGVAHRLANAVQLEIPNARAQIDRMTDALEAYGRLAPPVGLSELPEQKAASMALPDQQEPPSKPTEENENSTHKNKKKSTPEA